MSIFKNLVFGIITSILLCTPSYASFTKDDIKLAAQECVVVAPAEYVVGSKSFCDQGVFEKVTVVVSDDAKSFVSDLELNWIGFEIYSKRVDAFWSAFGGIVNKFVMEGITARINFRYGGGTLGRCFPNHELEMIVCEHVLDGRISVGVRK